MKRFYLWLLTPLLVAPYLLTCTATPTGVEEEELRVAPVFDLGESGYGKFGTAAEAGLHAAEAEAQNILRKQGIRLILQRTIDTEGEVTKPAVLEKIHGFLDEGGRILFGGATTGETNKLLRVLEGWAQKNKGFSNPPILLFVPVSTSILRRPETGDGTFNQENSRWTQNKDDPLQLFRIAVSDQQALTSLFDSKGPDLRYEEATGSKNRVLPRSPETKAGMVLFAEQEDAMSQAAEAEEPDAVKTDGLIDCSHLDASNLRASSCNGQSFVVNDYVSGFLSNLNNIVRPESHQPRVVFWRVDDRQDDVRRIQSIIDQMLQDPDIKSVGYIGSASFVERVNGLFVRAIRDAKSATARHSDSEARDLPENLWRFTGGTVKIEHLKTSPSSLGTFHGMHFLRTVPSRSLTTEEREILETIVAELPEELRSSSTELTEKVEDHSLHAYLGMLLLAETAVATKTPESPALSTAIIARRLRSYKGPESTSKNPKLFLPFFQQVWFHRDGDLRNSRHVYYALARGDGYEFYQVDLPDHDTPMALVIALTLGFLTAVVVLFNWKLVLGKRRRRVGPLGIHNPYVYGVPVTDPEMYFGRRDSFRKLVEEIESGPFVMLITGGRRSGKSSFLHFVTRGGLPAPGGDSEERVTIPSSVVPIYIDLQQLPNYPTEDELVGELLRPAIEREVAERGLELDVAAENGNQYRKLTQLFECVHRREPEWTILLLFDEIELLNDRFRDGTLSPDFPRLIKTWVQGSKTRVSIVFTGSPLQDFDLDSRRLWTPVSGMMKTLNLGPLNERETMALVSEPVAGEVIVAERIQRELFHLSGGQPFLCQAICHMALNALNFEGVSHLPTEISEATLEAAVEDFVENTPGHVDDMWSRFEIEEKYLLLLMAKRVARRHEVVTLEMLLGYAQAESFTVEEDEEQMVTVWKRTLEQLANKKGFVATTHQHESLQPGQIGYFFAIDLMRRWLQRKQIWPVIEELQRQGTTDTQSGCQAVEDDRGLQGGTE